MFPSVRSHHALLGKDAARAATRRIPPVLRGTVTGRYRRLIKPVGTPSRSYEPPLALAARATCYTVTSCYSRLPGHTAHWTRKSYFCRVCEALMPADSLEWPPLTASCLRV